MDRSSSGQAGQPEGLALLSPHPQMLGLELVSSSQIGVGCEELLRPAGPTADLEKGPALDRTQLQNPAVLLCPDVSKL